MFKLFFKEEPLYQAKQDTLQSGLALVNARAKAVREILLAIKDKQAQLKSNIEINTMLLKHENLSEADHKVIENVLVEDFDLQAGLEQAEITMKQLIHFLEECRKKIIAIDNSKNSETLIISDCFQYLKKKDFPKNFFSSNTFTHMNQIEKTFDDARKAEKNLIHSRMNATMLLMISLYSISFASLIAVGVGIALAINPIAGLAIIALTVGLFTYLTYRFEQDYQTLVKNATEINREIALEVDVNNELDLLV